MTSNKSSHIFFPSIFFWIQRAYSFGHTYFFGVPITYFYSILILTSVTFDAVPFKLIVGIYAKLYINTSQSTQIYTRDVAYCIAPFALEHFLAFSDVFISCNTGICRHFKIKKIEF